MKKDAFMQICRSKHTEPLTPEQEAFYGNLAEGIEKAFNEESVERGKQLQALADKIGGVDEGQAVMSVVRGLAQKVTELEANAQRGLTEKGRFNLKSKLEEKRDEIQRARHGGSPWAIEFSAKRAASALMQTSTVLTGAVALNNPNVFDDMEVTVIQYPKNFILDAISSKQVSKVPAYIRWKEQSAVSDGVPTVVAEGTVKPLTDKSFSWKTADRKKYAGRIEMTEEVEIDFEQLVLDIISMFEDDVLRAWQDGVLAEISAWASAYTATGMDGTIVKPNVYTVIGAAKLWCQLQNYEPDVVFVNPADAAEAIYLQDNDGAQQFIPEYLQFGGLTPFITNKVSAGTIIVGTRSIVKEQHSNFIIRKGVHGDQFIENESTIVGEVFSLLKLPTESKKGWIKVDVTAMKEALQKQA